MRAGLTAICATSMVAPFLWATNLRARDTLSATEGAAASAASASVAASATAAGASGVATAAAAVAPTASSGTALGVATSFDTGGSDDYLHRYLPANNSLELGGYVGAVFISEKNSFRGSPASNGGVPALRPYSEFKQPTAEFGARVGYFPFSFLGAELDLMIAPASAKTGSGTTVLAGRASVLVQSPLWSVVPFVEGGAGYWGTFSSQSGDDADPAFHFGGGLKAALTRDVDVRVDLRDTLTNGRPRGNIPNHLELTAGATWVLGREKAAPPDPDGDGFAGEQDSCPNEPGSSPDGCPARDRDGDQVLDQDDQCPDRAGPLPTGCPPADGDQDGVPDAQDQCPNQPGIAPLGCPADTDRDGVPDNADQCPAVPGPAPLGCPQDRDGDGIVDQDDKCPDQPETKNDYQDSDGCPDDVRAVERFTGVIAGIEFDTGRETLRDSSLEVLDEAAKILTRYPTLRVEVAGHTDDTGSHDHNLALSLARAGSVKQYLVAHGVAADRIRTRGAGPDEPLVTGKTHDARQKNRRIEFHVIQ